MDYYFSVDQDVVHEIKIKRSRFITHLHYCETMHEAKEYIHKISSQYKTANHICWAYIVGKNAENSHSSDAGEPSGSAGKPMLNALKKNNTTNIVAVVTRYFGGVKLGIRGLIDAYFQGVDEALNKYSLRKLVDYEKFRIQTSYDFVDKFTYKINEMGASITNIDYQVKITINFQVEKSKSEILKKYLTELSSKQIITELSYCFY